MTGMWTHRLCRGPWVGVLLGLVCWVGCTSEPAQRVRSDAPTSDPVFDAGASKPPSTRTLYSLARILAAQGREAECEVVLNRILTIDPHFTPAYNSLAEVAMRQDRVDDAIRLLTEGTRRKPREARLHNNLGMCWFLKHDYGRAIECFRQAASADPREPAYVANEAAALAMAGHDDEARALYEQQIFPEDSHSSKHNLTVLARARGELSPSTGPATSPATGPSRPEATVTHDAEANAEP